MIIEDRKRCEEWVDGIVSRLNPKGRITMLFTLLGDYWRSQGEMAARQNLHILETIIPEAFAAPLNQDQPPGSSRNPLRQGTYINRVDVYLGEFFDDGLGKVRELATGKKDTLCVFLFLGLTPDGDVRCHYAPRKRFHEFRPEIFPGYKFHNEVRS